MQKLSKDEIRKRLKQLEKQEKQLISKELKILKTLEKHKEQNQLYYYQPQEQQQPLYDALYDPTVKNFLALGGNRSGKSEFLITSLVSFALGYCPWDKNKTPLRFKPPVRIRLLCEDLDKHAAVLIEKLYHFIPQGELEETSKHGKPVEVFFKFRNGSTIEILSYKMDTDLFHGWSGHVAAFDEPPPRDKFLATRRGLVDFGGVVLMALTPLKEWWIHRDFVKQKQPDTIIRYLKMTENPHLNPDEIKSYKRYMTQDEITTLIDGQFFHLQGLVYQHEFDPDTHIKKPFPIPKDWTVYASIDLHPRNEQAVMFLACDPKQNYYICHEVYRHGTPTDIITWIADYHTNQHPVHRVIIDPLSKGLSETTYVVQETSFNVISRGLSAYMIPLDVASKAKDSGIMKVKECLKTPNGTSSLFFFDTCTRTLHEIQETYQWDEWRNKEAMKNPKQSPKDFEDHMMENLYRLILLNPQNVASVLKESEFVSNYYDPAVF